MDQLQPLTHRFRNFLSSQKLAPATIKNYVSDIQQFLDWLKDRLQEKEILPAHLTARVFTDYCDWINDPINQIQPATAERYLSSLKRFSNWLTTTGLTDTPLGSILTRQTIKPTVNQLLSDFRRELEQQKLSTSTIKNYVSDVNNYILWAVKNIKLTDNNLIKL